MYHKQLLWGSVVSAVPLVHGDKRWLECRLSVGKEAVVHQILFSSEMLDIDKWLPSFKAGAHLLVEGRPVVKVVDGVPRDRLIATAAPEFHGVNKLVILGRIGKVVPGTQAGGKKYLRVNVAVKPFEEKGAEYWYSCFIGEEFGHLDKIASVLTVGRTVQCIGTPHHKMTTFKEEPALQLGLICTELPRGL